MDDPIIQGVHHQFSNPAVLALWVKGGIVELIRSMENDLQERRIFAYLSRLRQTEELYYRALYVVFIAKADELPHIFSGDIPNGFTAIYRAVNRAIFDGRGTLETMQPGLSGGEFKAMQLLNDSAHTSFRFFLTCFGVARNREYQKDFGKLIAHLKAYCDYLNYMEQAFASGKSRADVLVAVRNLHKPASAWR